MMKSEKEKKNKAYAGNLDHEQTIWTSGKTYIAGIDECGRGPFSGPVVAAAVIMPKDVVIERLTDSKLLSKKEHESFAEQVKSKALALAVGIASVEEIDEINIKKASRLAMKRAVEGLPVQPDYLLIDGKEVVDLPIEQHWVIKGDYYSHSISAAAIIAKVARDQMMAKLDEKYGNVYGWAKNAGYQTDEHIAACHKHGLTEHHRKSWKTIELFK
jgi:ribonuclease HII